jgi:DHA1 family multidrug resistance protein-like MFS transporter
MVHVVVPTYLKQINLPDYMTGVLFAVMSLGLFIFAPLWGQLSDKFGRRILLLGPLGYGISQILFGLTDNVFLIVLFRFLSGAFAVANASLNPVYITDITSAKDRMKYLGIAALMMPVSISIGFLVGGWLPNIFPDIRTTFVVQGILSLIIFVFLYFLVRDAKEGQRDRKINMNLIGKNINILKKYSDTPLPYIIFLTFLNFMAFQMVSTQIIPILTLNLGFNTLQSGQFSATYNIIAAVTSVIIQRKLIVNFSPKSKLLPIAAFSSMAFAYFASLYNVNPVIVLIITFAGIVMINTIFVAVIQDLVASVDRDNERGALMGLNHAGQSLGMFVGALIGGFSLQYLKGFSPVAPVLFGGTVFLIIFLYNRIVLQPKINKYRQNQN